MRARMASRACSRVRKGCAREPGWWRAPVGATWKVGAGVGAAAARLEARRREAERTEGGSMGDEGRAGDRFRQGARRP